MKRYLLFASCVYYPAGGWSDFKETSDDLEYLISVAKTKYNSESEWWQIADTTTMEDVTP